MNVTKAVGLTLGIGGVLFLVATALTGCGRGAPGRDGHDGINGASCSVTSVPSSPAAPNGGSLVSCPGGTSSLVLNGGIGAQGIAGSAGTVVSLVSLCSPVTQYPVVFTEVAVCIQNKLYGVYSDHGGFLTELPPGLYSSYGINSSCTFTIGAGCVVSR